MVLLRLATALTLLFLTFFCGVVDSSLLMHSRDIEETLHVLKQRRRLKEPQSLLPFFINPFSPTLLCDWHYSSGEPDTWKGDVTWSQIATNPLTRENAGLLVEPCESVCVDIAVFEPFVAEILPLIKVKVLLFTHRWNLPQLNRTHSTDLVRRHPNVAHWFAQNPAYVEEGTYSAFPYGLEPVSLPEFGDAFLDYHDDTTIRQQYQQQHQQEQHHQQQQQHQHQRQGSKYRKSSTIQHLHVSDTHPSREKLIAIQEGRGQQDPLDVRQYYTEIAATRFLISPHGDRPDCYRHWEAIGLGAVPIANIDRALYGPMFGRDMVYVDGADEMIALLDDPSTLDSLYRPPQSHRVLTRYWTRRVDRERRRCEAAAAVGSTSSISTPSGGSVAGVSVTDAITPIATTSNTNVVNAASSAAATAGTTTTAATTITTTASASRSRSRGSLQIHPGRLDRRRP